MIDIILLTERSRTLDQQALYSELRKLESQINTLAELLGYDNVGLSKQQKEELEKTLNIAALGPISGVFEFIRSLTVALEELISSIIGS